MKNSDIYKKFTKESYIICVPSKGRDFLLPDQRGIWRYKDPKNTLDYPFSLITNLNLPPNDYIGKGYVCHLNLVPSDYNISEYREEAFEFAKQGGFEYLFIIDDDVIFFIRDEKMSSKYTCRNPIFEEADGFNRLLYDSIRLCSEKYPLVGVPNKQGSHNLKYMFPKNIPIIRFACYHVPTLIKEDLHSDAMGVPYMSDRYIQLSLLSRGYTTLSNCNYAVDDYGTGYRGGCSIDRNVENQSLSAIKLQETFPDYVTLKEKSNGQVWNETRLDCSINWRAFLKEEEQPYISKEQGLFLIGEN